jgi:UDP-glucuronate 4-epimerase
MTTRKILITGAAGFIGFHLAKRLCEVVPDAEIHGLDNMNAYYDPRLKEGRLEILSSCPNFKFYRMDLADRAGVERLFAEVKPDIVINLAAQAGVRYSLENPHAYVDSNVTGFLNILEGCRHHGVGHLLFASSSSVYGANSKVPFSVHDHTDHPVSLYAATKKANEMMAHSYAHLYRVPCTGLRFFTVYGPWGRPDMAYFKFVEAIVKGKPIDVYNHGDMKRDFTYIDDIIEGIIRLMDVVPAPDPDWSGAKPDPASSTAPYRLYNIGNNEPDDLMNMISILEEELGIPAQRNMLPMQLGDVYSTYADTNELTRVTGFKPYTPLREGLKAFVAWYKDYYAIKT